MTGPAYAVLAGSLREQIVRGALQPGDRLPVESQLCARHGVSRSTVREALRLLSSQGLVTTARGVSGGTFVASPGPGQIRDYLQASLGLLGGGAGGGAGTVADLLEVRELLEVPAAGYAARRRTQDQLARLRAALVDPRGEEPTEIYRANRDFHAGLLQAAANPLLEAVAGPVFTVLNERFVRDQAPAQLWVRVDRDHREIYARVEAGDEAGARRAAHEHLERLRGSYLRLDRQAGTPVRAAEHAVDADTSDL